MGYLMILSNKFSALVGKEVNIMLHDNEEEKGDVGVADDPVEQIFGTEQDR